jgi:hypothetical protein
MDVGARAIGRICFWDHENEGAGELSWDNVAMVADSFKALEERLW